MTIQHFTTLLLLLLVSTSVSGTEPDSAETNVTEKQGLYKFWYNEAELLQFPEPKPKLTPQCRGVFFKPATTHTDDSHEETHKDDGSQTISADRALYSAEGISVFEGNVIITQGSQKITSDKLSYHHKSKQLDMEGQVQIENQGLLITSEQANYDSELERSELYDAEFLIFENALNGRAEHVVISESMTNVYNNRITTCPPGKKNWELKSSELHLDQEKGWGHARNASLHIAKVPVFYTPYFTFPLDDRRKTGFLYPTFGADSINGIDVSTPYYINIAPNYDATLTPRVLSKRGNQIGAEFRYLNASGQGSLSGDYLGQDEINPVYSERKQAQWIHKKQFSDSWFADLDYAYVSDSDYFDDLDSLSNTSNLGYIERHGTLLFLDRQSYFSLLAQDFQVFDTIDEINQPYRLAPQVSAGHEHNSTTTPFRFNIDTQVSRFERDLESASLSNAEINARELATGERLVLQPQISADFSNTAWFIKPKAQLHHRQYQLQDYQAVDQDKELDFDVAIYSLDSGLIFERSVSFQQDTLKQTLEPRMKWVSIPFVDQSDAPNFDSSLYSFNQNQLFREQRYSGHDVIGDTEQIAYGVGSRIYNSAGVAKMEVEVGQIAYLQEREIQLNANENTQADFSPFFSSLKLQLIPDWKLVQKLQWNSEQNILERFSTGVHYKNDLNNLFNIEFRYRPANLTAAQKETRTSFFWPVGNRWKAMSFWNYDLEQKSTIELASGLEYENCCIIVRALNQKWLRRISSDNSYESANKQSLEIQLKGLGSLNNQISNYLSNRIVGFNE